MSKEWTLGDIKTGVTKLCCLNSFNTQGGLKGALPY